MPSTQPVWTYWYAVACAGLFGLVFGSFANVVIWRLPRGESLAHPPSACPRCGHPVRWHDNIPVVSWLVLGGKCRDCGEPISKRYPSVELLSGALFVLAAVTFGWSLSTVFACAFFYLLMILSFIDLDLKRLPDVLTATLAGVGIVGIGVTAVTGLAAGPLVGTATGGWLSSPFVAGVAGAALGAGLSLLLLVGYGAVRGKAGLGMGDVKLLGAMGLFLGPYVLLAFFVGTVLGLVPATLSMSRAKDGRNGPKKGEVTGVKDASLEPATAPAGAIPFGPFLAAGAVLTAVWGPAVWAWYASLVGIR